MYILGDGKVAGNGMMWREGDYPMAIRWDCREGGKEGATESIRTNNGEETDRGNNGERIV